MHDFIDTYNIELIAGRSFSKEYSTDPEKAIIINEKMAEFLGYSNPADALGTVFYKDDHAQSVIGVTNNFHHTSLQREVEPLILDLPEGQYGVVSNISNIVVKVNGQRLNNGIESIEQTWSKFDRSHPFEYYFHDDKLEELFKSEKAMGNVASLFSALCIIVACLGLFGLISYMTESRSKEIGIRKSLGASVMDIVTLISKDYLLIILLSNLIAWPVIFFAANQWLLNFTYRIELTEYLVPAFLGTGIIVLICSLLTVSYHSVKAAYINPAKTLKSE